jgi:hypothetical protein
MSALRWMGVMLAGLVTFVATGYGATVLLVRHGWEIFGWHDSVQPEVLTGAAVGALAGLAMTLLLHGWLSRGRGAQA